MDFFNIGKLKDTLSNYIRIKFELLKLDLTEHLSNILAQMIAYLIIVLVAIVVLTFLSIALALQLNVLLESHSLGFVVVSGLYLILLLVVLYLLKSGRLKRFFEASILSGLTETTKTIDEEK